jgi:hypothetical protein
MSDTQPIDLNSDALGTPSEGVADPFNGHIDGFRILQRSDYWIGIAWNKHEGPWCFRRGRDRGAKGGEPPPLARAGVVVCLMG